MKRVKDLPPEEIVRKIELFDKDLCTELFLGELKNVLPTPEQVRILQIQVGPFFQRAENRFRLAN